MDKPISKYRLGDEENEIGGSSSTGSSKFARHLDCVKRPMPNAHCLSSSAKASKNSDGPGV